MSGYVIGIPTLNREEMLGKTVEALMRQTVPPDMIVVVDNNEEPKVHDTQLDRTLYLRVRCDYNTGGCEQGYQTALRAAAKGGHEVFVKWDDDLIPEPDCLEEMIRPLATDCVACGGMFPKFGVPAPPSRWDEEAGKPVSADGTDSHLQMFQWEGEHRLIERKHLHSCFAMRINAALFAGGFCVMYSRYGQRGETDMSLRLAREGRLLVNTAAKAWHYCVKGGRRFGQAEMSVLAGMDNDLFRRRMVEHGIDPEGW